MRGAKVLTAVIGAGMLILATPVAAGAATGDFTYRYIDAEGAVQTGLLTDPPSQQCVTLPEVADSASIPADSPRNYTDEAATVYTGPGCQGDSFTLRALKGHGSERLKLRSVYFG